LGFVRTEPDSAAPDIQFNLLQLLFRNHGREIIQQHGFTMVANITRPESRGTVLAKSANPLEHPAIQPNYLASQRDCKTLRDGLRVAREIIRQDALKDVIADEFQPGAAIKSDADLDAYIRAEGQTVYHPVGTCKMGHDKDAVVDDRLCVRGIDRLRVADASIMPTLVSGNTNAPAIMIGERVADFIMRPETHMADTQPGVGSEDFRVPG
jgi:choline dehydrogenase